MVRINNPFQRSQRSDGRFYKHTIFCLLLSAVVLSVSTIILSFHININGGSDFQTVKPPRSVARGVIKQAEIAAQPTFSRNSVAVDDMSNKAHLSHVLRPIKGTTIGTQHSVIYQPVKSGRRLLTYRRFGGRLNNQLFQFITALQHAKVLKRTFVVPDEVREVDWTGMFDTAFGIWDIDRLNAAYDIDWRLGLSQGFLESIPDGCVLSPTEGRELLNGGPQLWEEWDRKCPDVIDLAGNTGLLFCKQQHQFCGDSEAQLEAYQIYSHFTLSPSLLQHIPSKKEEFRGKGYDELAIHSRRAGEGGYDWELCVKGNTRTCRGHVKSESDSYCDARTMKGNCAIWLDLDYQIKSKKALKENERDYRFVLASDGTHDWHIDFDGQFLTANNTDWLFALEKKISGELENGRSMQGLGVSSFARKKLARSKDVSPLKSTINALTSTLLDLFSLVDSKYLLGGYYSTLSLNACYLRGLDRMYESNMCWMLMHPTTEYSVQPSKADAVHLNGNADMPAALMSDVEHAFVRSNDGNFIAIDRYLIQYKKDKRSRKAKEIIGVLGDGLVPLRIEKNDKGEERILAEFTCSYGNDHSPATVILMKGDQSYHEHYYERGEKYKSSPFSTNGDRFRTLLILCEELRYDKSLSRHPPLILSSPDDKFHLRIGSSFARPVAAPRHGRTGKAQDDLGKKKVAHCLNPVYGLKDPRWLIEYLEYHIAIGVDHFHIYNIDMHSTEVQSILEIYRGWGFITRHDWSAKASGQYTTRVTYEHAKWAAQTDCALRSRGQYEYALFGDIDEVAMVDANGLAPALDLCEEAHTKRGVIGCSFNSNTVSSVFTKLTDDEEMKMTDKLLLERYTYIEAKPFCPSNCRCLGSNCKEITRKYHHGRQKYMLNVKDLSVPPRPLWTHAISRDYDEMDELMEQLPDDVFHIRHYQGHWLKNKNILNTMEEKHAPLPKEFIERLREIIFKEPPLRSIYAKANVDFSSGVEWVTPVERPAKYHTLLIMK